MSSEIINIGKYKFNIQDNISKTKDGVIYSRNFKIGGKYTDCVNVSISYDAFNNPISAKIPTLVYDEECSLITPLDRGEGTVIMIKILLRYIKNKIPEINEFVFEDKSNIECGTEEEIYQKRHRKRGTHARPIELYYFSIAFNGITWYEKHFNAYQKDLTTHNAYKVRVRELLQNKEIKPSFNEFLRIAQPPIKIVDELQIFYENADTYGDFFNSISKDDRCRLVRGWVSTFMEYYLKDVFSNKDWVIDVRKMDEKNKQYGGTRKKRGYRKTKRYYCPIGKIKLAFQKIDMGV